MIDRPCLGIHVYKYIYTIIYLASLKGSDLGHDLYLSKIGIDLNSLSKTPRAAKP